MFKGLFGNSLSSGLDGELISITIFNSGVGCDPLLGLCRAVWTVAGDVSGAVLNIYADFGSGYTLVAGAINPTDPFNDFSVSGYIGFTSLDDTEFRFNLVAGITELAGSPMFIGPAYPCL